MDELDGEAANLLGNLGKIEPDAETAQRAIFRARAMLLKQSTKRCHRPWIIRFTASSAACLVFALAYWLIFGAFGAATFAAVQKRVAGTRSVVFTMWGEDAPEDKSTVRILETGLMREEFGQGNYRVTDFLKRRVLDVDAESNEAHLVRGMSPRMQQNLYERIRDVPANSMEMLPPARVDGQLAQIYRSRLKLDGLNEEEFVVWVDSQTLLPVRMESKPMNSEDEQERTIIAGIRFNEAQFGTSFSTDPPPGMNVTVIGLERLQDMPSEARLSDPELKPGFGIGHLKFGMTRKQALKVLGKPDQTDPETDDMDYFSRGYSIGFDEQDCVSEVDCYTQDAHSMEVRDFKGHTANGIRMGASRAALEKIYGAPETTERDLDSITLYYPSCGLTFTLKNNLLIRIFMTNFPACSR